MALLRKIKGATLIETIIASVLVLVIFVTATLTINNVFYSSVINDSFAFQNRMKELHYQTMHKKTRIPFFEETSHWEINIQQTQDVIVVEGLLKSNGLSIKSSIKNE